jgi:hypothetical protein
VPAAAAATDPTPTPVAAAGVPATPSPALVVAAAGTAATDPVAIERGRITDLLALRAKWPSFGATIDACISDGSSVAVAKDAILAATEKLNQQELARLSAASLSAPAQAAAAAAVNGNSDTPARGSAFSADDVKARFEAGEYGNRYRSAEQAIRWELAAHQVATNNARA